MAFIERLFWFNIVIATILAIVALFLNIGVHSKLSPDQQVQFAQLKQQNQNQCNQTTMILQDLAPVAETLENTTVDTTTLPMLQACEQYIRDNNPELKNASAIRLLELLEFNETVAPQLALLLPGLAEAQSELDTLSNSLQNTGIIQTYQSGTVDVNMGGTSFPYALKSITLGGEELYYIDIPKSPSLLMVMNNISDVVFDLWNPSIGSGCDDNCTRVDSVMDRQQEKVMSTPKPIMFESRTYPNGTSILLSGQTVLMVGDFIGVADAVHMGF